MTAHPSQTTPALDDQLCFALYAASRAVVGTYRPGLSKLGLTYPQYLTLLALWEKDEVSVVELGARLRLDTSTLSPLLTRLEVRGLVARTRSTSDERRVHVKLTQAGVALAAPATKLSQEVAAKLSLTDQEIKTLRSLIERVTEASHPVPTTEILE